MHDKNKESKIILDEEMISRPKTSRLEIWSEREVLGKGRDVCCQVRSMRNERKWHGPYI